MELMKLQMHIKLQWKSKTKKKYYINNAKITLQHGQIYTFIKKKKLW